MTAEEFRCPECGADFETPEELANHQDIAHLPGESTPGFTCETCGASLATPEQLEAHKQAVHSR